MYPLAQRYLGQAVAASPSDAASAERLKLTQFVLTWDPFRQNIPDCIAIASSCRPSRRQERG